MILCITAIIPLRSVNQLVFMVETEGVSRDMWTEFFYTM
jgi:hypothetical protein